MESWDHIKTQSCSVDILRKNRNLEKKSSIHNKQVLLISEHKTREAEKTRKAVVFFYH